MTFIFFILLIVFIYWKCKDKIDLCKLCKRKSPEEESKKKDKHKREMEMTDVKMTKEEKKENTKELSQSLTVKESENV